MNSIFRSWFGRDSRSDPHHTEARVESTRGVSLHIGSGSARIDGWINIDIQKYPGVDVALDVREGLPFEDAPFIFAEHFVEHLSYAEGLEFLRECRRALRRDGVLRLSTPNLDWVWFTQYHPTQWASSDEAIRDCFWMNKAFRGWGHQFLYNLPALRAALEAAGFAQVEPCTYGESRNDRLRNLERHEQYPDTPDLPHVIVVEAYGLVAPRDARLSKHAQEYLEALGLS